LTLSSFAVAGEVGGAHDAGLRAELGDAQLRVRAVPAGGEVR
jgi:hypothetical protein